MISVWERDTFYRDADVLIVGGGLMGLWTAYELTQKQPGLKVTISEALPVPALASTRNAGFACFGSPSELWHDLQTMGEDAMWQVVEMRYKGIHKLRKILGDENIGYEPSGGFEVFDEGDKWNGDAMQEKLNHLNKGLETITGLQQTYRTCTADLESFGLMGFSAMAGNRIEGGLHSGKMVYTLLKQILQAGVVFLAGHRVVQASGMQDSLQVQLQAGEGRNMNLNSRRMIWATNAMLGATHAFDLDVHPARGQLLLSPPIEGLRLQGTFHAEEGYYYFRNLDNRLLIGGARHKAFNKERTMDDTTSEEIIDHLKNYIRNHLPQVAAYLNQPGWMEWAGIMGMSGVKKPMVQEITPGIWAALACNGMGVALTPIVAEEAARQLLNSLR